MIPSTPIATRPADYAWNIVRDHLADHTPDETPGGDDDAAGTYGPRLAPDVLVDALDRRATEEGRAALEATGIRTAVFKMYDDDGILYYTGVLAYRTDVEGEEHVVAGPLADFGMPNAGCTNIEYPHHLNWAVG